MFPVNTGQKEVGEGGETTVVGKRGSICARGPAGRSRGLASLARRGAAAGPGAGEGSGPGEQSSAAWPLLLASSLQSIVLSGQLFLAL